MPANGLMPTSMRLFQKSEEQGDINRGQAPVTQERQQMQDFEPSMITPGNINAQGFELLEYFQPRQAPHVACTHRADVRQKYGPRSSARSSVAYLLSVSFFSSSSSGRRPLNGPHSLRRSYSFAFS